MSDVIVLAIKVPTRYAVTKIEFQGLTNTDLVYNGVDTEIWKRALYEIDCLQTFIATVTVIFFIIIHIYMHVPLEQILFSKNYCALECKYLYGTCLLFVSSCLLYILCTI